MDWVLKAEACQLRFKDRNMRAAVLRELLAAQTATGLVDGLDQLQSRARSGHIQARATLQALALDRSVLEAVSEMVRERALGLARERTLVEVARMLCIDEPQNANPTMDEARTDNDYATESVGARCAAARRSNRNKLDRLLHDRDHRVIRILLNNPLLVEHDVVKIVAMRPTRPEVLEVVANHSKWASRYKVRKALACNPHTPLPIAQRLIPTLMRQDLRLVMGAGTVPKAIRDQVRALLVLSF